MVQSPVQLLYSVATFSTLQSNPFRATFIALPALTNFTKLQQLQQLQQIPTIPKSSTTTTTTTYTSYPGAPVPEIFADCTSISSQSHILVPGTNSVRFSLLSNFLWTDKNCHHGVDSDQISAGARKAHAMMTSSWKKGQEACSEWLHQTLGRRTCLGDVVECRVLR